MYILHSSLIGLVLSLFYTKSGHPSGLSICCSLNSIASVLHDYISEVDIPRSPGRVLDVLYVCVCTVPLLSNRTHTRLHSYCAYYLL